MIKYLTPKSKEELEQVKINERSTIIKFAVKKLANFKRLPEEISMSIRPDLYFKIDPEGNKRWRLFYPLQNDRIFYYLTLKRSKSGKWKVTSITYNDSNIIPIDEENSLIIPTQERWLV